MATASVSQAKARLSALLERVRAGERITITDRGVPVAQLVPVTDLDADRNERVRRLERAGVVTRPRKKLDPEWLRSRPLATSRGSVLEALLGERGEDAR